MRARPWRAALTLAMATVLALSGCNREPPPQSKQLLFPTLAARQDEIDSLRLRGAGNAALVTILRKDHVWRVAERGDWPADAGHISQYLFLLSQAHGVEAKTADSRLFARLGVEPIARADAAGSELQLSGAGVHWRLLIGHEHPKLDANYVRVDDQAQTWLTDLPVGFERNPAAWLDRRLLDLPLARIATVQVSAAADAGAGFSLSHRDDRFRLDGVPAAAMHDSQLGDKLAAALDQLQFEDLAADNGSAKAERTLRFTSVDGVQVSLQAWHVGEQVWVRIEAGFDAARAAAWAAQARIGAASAQSLAATGAVSGQVPRQQVSDWNQRFLGRRFQLPAATGSTLMLGRDDILAGAPPP